MKKTFGLYVTKLRNDDCEKVTGFWSKERSPSARTKAKLPHCATSIVVRFTQYSHSE